MFKWGCDSFLIFSGDGYSIRTLMTIYLVGWFLGGGYFSYVGRCRSYPFFLFVLDTCIVPRACRKDGQGERQVWSTGDLSFGHSVLRIGGVQV